MADKNFNDDGDDSLWTNPDNWLENVKPADGESVAIGAYVVTYDEDMSLWANGINGLTLTSTLALAFSVDANTYLKMMSGTNVTLTNSVLYMGYSGNPIQAGYTAKIEMNPSANGVGDIILTDAANFVTQGTATWGRAGTAWVAEIFDDGTGATAADDHIHIDTNLVPVVANDVEIFIEQTSGTYTHYDLMRSFAWTDEGGGSYKIEFDYNVVDAGDTDLNYAHAVGAKVYVVSRNVQIFSGSAFGWQFADGATTTKTTCAETYFRDSYRHNTKGDGSSFDHCVFDLIKGSPGLFNASGGVGLHYNWDDVLICRNELYATLIATFHGLYHLNNVHFQGIDSRLFYSGSIGLYWRGGRCNTRKTGVLEALRIMPGSFIENVEFEADQAGGILAVTVSGNLDIRSCDISDDLLTDSGQLGMRCMLNNTLVGGNLTANYGAVYSVNHNQDPGAVRAEIHGSIIEKQATTTYDGSDWALEITPYSNISAANPLWVKLADIPCKGGTPITVTARCAVNTAYGHASGDPSLVLDRGDCHGIETTVPWVLTSDSNPPEAADWEIATTGAQTPSGDGDDDITVELWIKIPYYAAGAAVFVDDFVVTGSSSVVAIDMWPAASLQAAGGGIAHLVGDGGGLVG